MSWFLPIREQVGHLLYLRLEMGSSSNIYQHLTHQMRTAQDTGSEQWRLLAVLLRQGWYLVNKGLGYFYSTPPHREKALHVVVVLGVLL